MSSAFIRIANADGKVWILPTQHMRTALHLYQPGGIKGKMLKLFLPGLWRFSWVRRFLHIEFVPRPYEELSALIREVFEIEGDYEQALFEGTPCVHQKATLQIFQGRDIRGYVKISASPSVVALFEKEVQILDYLHALGVEHVPTCLALRECSLRDGSVVNVFVQTTTKSARSQLIHEWNPFVEDFLADLQRRTLHEVPFLQTTLAENILAVLPIAPNPLKLRYESLLAEYEGKNCLCCLNHGDFTPWNMYVQDGQLEVFDWEYASFCNPIALDRCHFFVQTALFEKKYSAEQIVQQYIQSPEERRDFRLYLLAVSAHYLRRDSSCVESREMKVWMELLDRIDKI